MKKIHELSSEIDAAAEQLSKLEEERERCDRATAAGQEAADALAALEAKRKEIVGAGFLENTKPDTAEVDSEIRRATKTAEAARTAADAAASARELVEERLTEKRAELEALKAKRQGATVDELKSRFDAAKAEYTRTIESAIAAVHRMGAIGNILRRETGSAYWVNETDFLVLNLRERGLENWSLRPDRFSQASAALERQIAEELQQVASEAPSSSAAAA